MIACSTLTVRHSWWTRSAILTAVVLLPCLSVRATRASGSGGDSEPAANRLTNSDGFGKPSHTLYGARCYRIPP